MSRARRAALLAAGLALLGAAACARRVGLKEQDATVEAKEVLVGALSYDAKGRPIVPAPLARRPSASGERFTIVRLQHGRPDASFDVVVTGRRSDFRKPLRAVYEWTGEGLRWGLGASGTLAESILNAPNSLGDSGDARGAAAMAAVYLVIIVSPTVIGAVGGSAVGLTEGMGLSAQELSKRMAGTRERMVSYTAYSYDARDRLVLARLYAVEGGKELVRTEYRYAGDAAIPTRAEITNLQDGKSKLLE
jgi:hypothetical protein